MIKIVKEIYNRYKKKKMLFAIKRMDINFSYIDEIYYVEEKQSVNRWVIFLPGRGCSWARKENGGCFMCGFNNAIDEILPNRNLSDDEMMLLFSIGEELIFPNSPKLLTIYNGGSFLNDEEISENVQLNICRYVRRHHSIDLAFVESRPEFIKEDKIKMLITSLGSKKLMIGIGLECVDDKIRIENINKGFLRKDYEKACRVLKSQGVKILTYVFIKPLYLTEQEAIDQAVKTAKYAFEQGTDEVAFESAFIQKNTKMAKIYNKEKFKPPWLWSIIEVVKSSYNLGNVSVGNFQDLPEPIAVPYNCDRCSSKIMELLNDYKKTHNIEIFNKIRCKCKKEYLNNLRKR